MITIGASLPSMTLMTVAEGEPREISTEQLFGGKKTVMFAVPGAFTPTCSEKHLPGYIEHADEILGKGIDQIVCLSVNDVFVMAAWAKSSGVGERIKMLADGSGAFTKALGLELDLVGRGLGMRAQRFAMVLDGMKLTYLGVEPPGGFGVSTAEQVMAEI